MKELLPYLTGAGVIGLIGTLLLFGLKWLRFSKKDNAEAHEIRARADVLITDGALRIVDRLSKDLDEARDEIERLISVITEGQKMFEKSRIDFALENDALRQKLEEAKTLMDTKKRHCIETKDRLAQLRDLLLLKQQGLTHEQLQDFVKRLNELMSSTTITQ